MTFKLQTCSWLIIGISNKRLEFQVSKNYCDVNDIFNLTFCKPFIDVVFPRAEFMIFCGNVHVMLIIAAQLLFKVSMELTTSLLNKKRYLQLLR